MSGRDVSDESPGHRPLLDTELFEYLVRYDESNNIHKRTASDCKSPDASSRASADEVHVSPSTQFNTQVTVHQHEQNSDTLHMDDKRCNSQISEVPCERLPNDYAQLFWHSHNYGVKTVTPHFIANILGLEKECTVTALYSSMVPTTESIVLTGSPKHVRSGTVNEQSEKEVRSTIQTSTVEPLNLTTKNQGAEVTKDKRKPSEIKYGE